MPTTRRATGRRERAEASGRADLHVAVVGEREDDEHEHEGADDLGDQVPAVGADGGPVEKTPSLVAASGSSSKCCL
jgi:hypothetical protein